MWKAPALGPLGNHSALDAKHLKFFIVTYSHSLLHHLSYRLPATNFILFFRSSLYLVCARRTTTDFRVSSGSARSCIFSQDWDMCFLISFLVKTLDLKVQILILSPSLDNCTSHFHFKMSRKTVHFVKVVRYLFSISISYVHIIKQFNS